MPNSSPTIIYEVPTQEQMVDDLIEFLEEHKSYQDPKSYTIVEYFPINKPEPYIPRTYNVINLEMGTEDGLVFCDDLTGKLDDVRLVLSGFSVEDVLYIGQQASENKITISVNDGYIQIYY